MKCAADFLVPKEANQAVAEFLTWKDDIKQVSCMVATSRNRGQLNAELLNQGLKCFTIILPNRVPERLNLLGLFELTK